MTTVDDDRRATAAERRRLVLEAFAQHLAPAPESAATRLRERLDEPRFLVGNLDIDGLCSAALLASVTPWRIAALVDRSADLRVSPEVDFEALLEDGEGRLFGVDVFSPLFPSASNHPLLFGDLPRRSPRLRDHYKEHDGFVHDRVNHLGSISPSTWAGIGASLGSGHPQGLPYKYPLGTTQVLLAALEAAAVPVRLFDRQYLPWMIANADGGVTSIRSYAWNVELWWSAMAAAAGPASYSEAIYQLVSNQRPNQFLDVDRRLRYDEPERSVALKSSWNLKSSSPAHVNSVVELIAAWSGWPDPFLGGVSTLPGWVKVEPAPTTGLLPLAGITGVSDGVLDAHLDAARQAVHVNFSVFKERGTALGWMLSRHESELAAALGADTTQVGVTEVEAEPDLDQESVPDAD